MSVAITWTPSACRRAQIAAPMPLAAPVTSARLPCSPLSGIGGAVDVDGHARHIGGVVGAERDDQWRRFRPRAHAAHPDLRPPAFLALAFFSDCKNHLQTAAC